MTYPRIRGKVFHEYGGHLSEVYGTSCAGYMLVLLPTHHCVHRMPKLVEQILHLAEMPVKQKLIFVIILIKLIGTAVFL